MTEELPELTELRNFQSWQNWRTTRADRTEELPELTELRNCQSWQNCGNWENWGTEELTRKTEITEIFVVDRYWLRYWQNGPADVHQLGWLLLTAPDWSKNVNDLALKQLIVYWLYMLIDTEYKWLNTETINCQLTTWMTSKCLFCSLPMLDLFVDCTWI